MVDHDPETPSRVGSYADLARRIERVEGRHESLEKEVRELAQTVGRVEQNQEHATELNKLRFDALDTGVKSIGGQLADFMKRIEGILTGEVQTAQTAQGQAIVKAYEVFRDKTTDRLDALEEAFSVREAKQEGVVFALTGGKAILLSLAAVAGPVIAVIALVVK